MEAAIEGPQRSSGSELTEVAPHMYELQWNANWSWTDLRATSDNAADQAARASPRRILSTRMQEVSRITISISSG